MLTNKLNQHTATLTFTLFKQDQVKTKLNDYLQISPYYKDFEYFGKHYLIGASA